MGIRAFAKNLFLNALIFAASFYALFKTRKLDPDCGLDRLVDFAFRDYGTMKPAQLRSEISELLKILSGTKPKFILEIGTFNGGTLFLFCRVASQSATIISVDLRGGPFGGGYPQWRIPLYKSFALPNQQIHLIRADSHHRGTLEQVKAILGGEQIDFLFIDGDHTYEGVKMDFEMYSPLVKKDGIVAFHDMVICPPQHGVNKFWSEIKRKYEHIEIVENWDQYTCGIGLLFMK